MNRKKLITLLLSLLLFLSNTIFCMELPQDTQNIFNEIREDNAEKVKEFIAGLMAGNENYDSQLLFDTATFNTYETMLELLKYGVNINSGLDKNTSILDHTFGVGQAIKKITLLLQYGANPLLSHRVRPSFAAFIRNNTLQGLEIIYLVSTAQENWNHMSKNEFKEVYESLFETSPTNQALAYNALFALLSKKRFKEFEHVIQKKLCENFNKKVNLNLEKILLKTASPQLLQHFLERGIFEWNDKMLEKFLGRQQRRDLMRYKYHDTSIAKIPYDIHIIYDITNKKRKFNQINC